MHAKHDNTQERVFIIKHSPSTRRKEVTALLYDVREGLQITLPTEWPRAQASF